MYPPGSPSRCERFFAISVFVVLMLEIVAIWSMEYPSESPYGVAGRIWYMRVSVVGG